MKELAELLEQLIQISEDILASDDFKLLVSQHHLAVAYIEMGKDYYGRAAELLE